MPPVPGALIPLPDIARALEILIVAAKEEQAKPAINTSIMQIINFIFMPPPFLFGVYSL